MQDSITGDYIFQRINPQGKPYGSYVSVNFDGKQVTTKTPEFTAIDSNGNAVVSTDITAQNQRPSPLQSEQDVGLSLGSGARAQVSYLDGAEVPYGTHGSVRPDFCVGSCSVEVKNYLIINNKYGLVNNVTKQAFQRQKHLPQGMTQMITIDVRGQSYTAKDLAEIKQAIVQKTNGIISANIIRFKEF